MLTATDKFGKVFHLASQIEADDERVSFRNIFENKHGGVSLIAFKAGQELTEHVAPAEVMVYVVEGKVDFALNGEVLAIHAGEFLLLGKGVLHAVTAPVDAKVMLVKVEA